LTALPWYLWVGLETKGEFLSGFLLKHNLQRGTTAMENHHGFPGYYLMILLVGTTPWSIFLVLAFWFGCWSAIRSPWTRWQGWWLNATEGNGGIGERAEEGLTDRTGAYRLLICWIVVYVVFFSIAATKLPNYVLPVIVPSTMLIARFLQRWGSESVRMPGWLIQGSVASLLLIGVLFSAGMTIAGGVGELSFLRGRYFPGLERWAFLGFFPMLAAAACWWFARNGQYSRFISAVAVCAILLLGPMAAFGSVVFNRCKAPWSLVEQSATFRRDEDIRIGCWQLEHLPSLNFYVKRNVEHFHDENALPCFLNSRLPVYLFIPLEDWRRVEGKITCPTRILARQRDMYHHTEVVVVTNR
jgi:4-amino-4-deoxy-L-arabinose transferase-like glycosyltransferase